MFRKTALRLLVVLLLVAVAVGVVCVNAAEAAQTDGLVLEDMIILQPADATVVEKTACKELQIYLQAITGKKPLVAKEYAGAGKAIYVGATKFAAENNVTYTDEVGGGEGWAIQTVGSSLVITGGRNRGVLYGVYHLLEDVLGVHWWNQWEEYVPSMEDAVIPADYADSGEPAFYYRDVYFAESIQGLFAVRNRLNGYAGWIPAEYGGEAYYTAPYHSHTFAPYFPPSIYFKDHPEWYAYDQETQSRITDGQLCLTNPELLKVFTAKVLESIRSGYAAADAAGLPRPVFTDISPNDRAGHCECPYCLEVRNTYGESAYLLRFVNAIADAVYEVYPEIKVETLAFWQYFDVPKDDTVPADNVVIRLASSDMDIIQNMHHVNNTKPLQRLREWSNLLKPGQLMFWDYGMMTGVYNGIMPNYFRFAKDYQTLLEAGCIGIFMENGGLNHAEMWDARAWILAKIMEDPYQDIYAVAKEFTTGYYGAAAGEDVYNYMVYMSEEAERNYEIIRFGNFTTEAPWLNGVQVMKANSYFDAAVAKTKADTSITEAERQLYLDRINVARGALDRTILHNYAEYAEDLAAAGQQFGVHKVEVGQRLYRSLDWLHNLTAGEDLTGIQNVQRRGSYVGDDFGAAKLQEIFTCYRGETDANGELWWPELPQSVKNLYPNLSTLHMYDFPASSFTTTASYVTRVENAASYAGGSAMVLDQAAAIAAGAAKEDVTFSTTASVKNNRKMKLTVGNPLIADGAYHMYNVKDLEICGDNSSTVVLFGCIRIEMRTVRHLDNRKDTDLCISMKIVGDPASGKAKIYVDRLVVVEDCSAYDIPASTGANATCASNAQSAGKCPVCAKAGSTAGNAGNVPHALTGDYTYNASAGTYSAPCAFCGTATFKVDHQLPVDFLNELKSKGIGLEHVREFSMDTDFVVAASGTTTKNDTSTPVGVAAVRTGTFPVSLSLYGASNTLNFGSLDPAVLKNNSGKGYVTYKVGSGTIPTTALNYGYTFDWHVQSTKMVKELQDLAGQNVDAYISVKVTGTGTYTYYFDRAFIVERCAGCCGAGRTPNNYTVRFNTNGGSYLAETRAIHGQTLAQPSEPTRTGYSFVGWYFDNELYDFSAPVTAPLTLYARWTTDTGFVAQANGIKYKTLSEAVKATIYNGTVELLANTDEKVVVNKNMIIVQNGFTAANLTTDTGYKLMNAYDAYMVWDPNILGEGMVGPLPPAVAARLAEKGLSRACVFDFGAASLNGSGSTFPELVADAGSPAGSAVRIIAANWKNPIEYIHKSFGVATHPSDGNTIGQLTKAAMKEKQGRGYQTYAFENIVVPDVDIQYVYTMNWYIQNRDIAKVWNGLKGQTVDLYISMKVDGDVDNDYDSTKYPQYYIDRMILVSHTQPHTVTFENDGVRTSATVFNGMSVAEPVAPSKEGFTFDGWYLNGVKYDFTKPVTGDITLVAHFTENVAEEPVILEGTLAAIEVSMDSELLLWQKFELPAELLGDDDAYAVVTADKKGGLKETIIPMSEIRAAGADKNGRYIIEQGMAAPEMGRSVTVSFVDGNGNYVNLTDYLTGEVATSVSRTVVDYSKLALEKGTTKQKNLNKALLTYGGYAQIFFNVDASAPVYNVLPEMGFEVPDMGTITGNSISQEMINRGEAGVNVLSQQAFLDSAIYHRVYIKLSDGVSVEDLSFELTKRNKNGEYTIEVEPVYETSGNRYYIQIDGIASPLLDYMYNIRVFNWMTFEEQNITTSVACWLKLGITKSTNAKQVNMFKAMYNYNQVANTFFGF